MVQDGDIVTMKGCCIASQNFVVGGDRIFKFGRQVDRSKCCPTDDKPSLKEAWSGHGNHLNFWGSNHTSVTVEATVVKFCTSPSYRMLTNHPEKNPF